MDGLVQRKIGDLAQVWSQYRSGQGEGHHDHPDGAQYPQKPEAGIRLWGFGLLVHPCDPILQQHLR
jgi:hypothetical protein